MSVPAVVTAPVLDEDKKDRDSAAALFDMGLERSDLGAPNSLRYGILVWVLDEKYDKAIEELRTFHETPSEYPNFQDKIGRYVTHGVDLIYAIKAKRSFPGISSLTRAKQQELREKFKEHFKELQYILKIIEKIQGDLRIQDVRSTIYVVRALCYAVGAIFVLGLSLEIMHGLLHTSIVVFDDIFGQLAGWIAAKIGF